MGPFFKQNFKEAWSTKKVLYGDWGILVLSRTSKGSPERSNLQPFHTSPNTFWFFFDFLTYKFPAPSSLSSVDSYTQTCIYLTLTTGNGELWVSHQDYAWRSLKM